MQQGNWCWWILLISSSKENWGIIWIKRCKLRNELKKFNRFKQKHIGDSLGGNIEDCSGEIKSALRDR